MTHDLTQLLGGVVDKLSGFLPGDVHRRGNPGYHVASMVACFIVMFLTSLDSERDLAAYLKNHPEIVSALRLYRAPVATTFGRFRKRLGSEKLAALVDRFGKELIESKQIVVDSTLMEKHDSEAKWGKSSSKGWIYGYKAHVSCDAKSGLPIRVRMTTANRHDSPMLPELIKELEPKAVIGDSAYDSNKNIDLIVELKATPAIAFNKRAEKGKGYNNKNTSRYKMRKNKKRKKLLRKRYIVEQLNNLIHELLNLKKRFVKGLEACSFYAQLTALTLLAQANWAGKTGLPQLKRRIKYFRRQ